MTEYIVEVDDKSVQQLMDRALTWLDPSNIAPFTRETFTDIMREAVVVRFDTESNGGTAWAPLDENTIRRREMAGYGPGPINVQSGAMRAFLINSLAHGGPTGDGVEFVWPDEADSEMQDKLETAAGYKAGTPARPVIDADQQDVDQFIDRAFLDFERFMQ